MGRSMRCERGPHAYPRASSQIRWHSSRYSTTTDPSVIAVAWAVKWSMIAFFLRQHVRDHPLDYSVAPVYRAALHPQAVDSSFGVIERQRHRVWRDSRGG